MGLALLLVGALVVLVAVIVSGQVARDRALQDIRVQAEATLVLDRALLESELDRHRATPVVLGTEDELRAALTDGDPGDVARVNARLEMLATRTGAAAIYVIDDQGRAVAANNYRTTTSFVGSNYAFRPYFQAAMREGATEYFALGTVSGRPGLYLARRIDSVRGPLGVVVVKVELDKVEAAWRRQAGGAMVADRDGVILLASQTDRQFRTLTALPEARRRALRETRQFGSATLEPLPSPLTGPDGGIVRVEGKPFLQLRRPLPVENWTLILLTPTVEADRAAVPVRWTAALAGGLLIVILTWAWRSRLRAVERERDEAETRRELERRVGERTEALTAANLQLQGEIDDRERAEARLRSLQADLVQANRLAQLGQIVAGVAHEINQPVAAIRANADNALTLLSRQRPEDAQVNLGRIQGLTERIGGIVEELRGFARKTSRRISSVAVDEAIEGALLLVGSRMRGDRVALERTGERDLHVLAHRVRLEQVLVNLLQNAFEALDEQTGGEVRLDVAATSDIVTLAVIDNGPGLSAEVRAALFTPFSTTKPQGLGLGLVISKDIVDGFGGTLEADPDWTGGARFLIRLPRTPA